MRFAASGFGIALGLAALLAAPALAQQSSVPAELQGLVGDFVLAQEDEALPVCPVTLTDEESLGGWAVVLPAACPAPYPAADDLVAWNVDGDDGSVYFLNAERKVVLRLFEDEDGLYDTDPGTSPRFYLLAPYQSDGSGGEADSD